MLGLPVRVIVPKTTKPLMLDKIRAQGAEVEVGGWVGIRGAIDGWMVVDGGQELGENAWSKFEKFDSDYAFRLEPQNPTTPTHDNQQQ